MGFSVTASMAIFFIAALTAGSVAMNVWWDTTRTSTEAHDRWQRLASSQLKTNLTLTINSCNAGCNPATPPDVRVRMDVRNSGSTVVDFRNLTYIIDGVLHTVTNVTARDIVAPTSISNTDLIIPGETMRVEFQNVPLTTTYTTSTLPIQVITLDGVIGRR